MRRLRTYYPYQNWLREHDTNSKRIHLILPIFLTKIAHGKLKLTLDRERLPEYLSLSAKHADQLTIGFFFNYQKIKKVKSLRIDYKILAFEYDQLLKSGTVKNKAELARKFNVSRAWITKVFKLGNR